jgi:hypothetical protein
LKNVSSEEKPDAKKITRGRVKAKAPNETIRYITEDGVEHTKARKLPIEGFQGAIR